MEQDPADRGDQPFPDRAGADRLLGKKQSQWDRQGVVDQHVHADRGARPLWKKDEKNWQANKPVVGARHAHAQESPPGGGPFFGGRVPEGDPEHDENRPGVREQIRYLENVARGFAVDVKKDEEWQGDFDNKARQDRHVVSAERAESDEAIAHTDNEEDRDDRSHDVVQRHSNPHN